MDSKLPFKWFYKTRKDTYQYLDSQGNYFPSKDAALRYHLQEGGENSETDQMLQDFINNLVPVYNKGHGIDSRWMRNDPRVPKGWMIKERQNGLVKNYHLLSPEERCFSGYRLALKFIIETNQPAEIIEDMRECMKNDDWFPIPNVPVGWLYKKSKGYSFFFIDPTGSYFKSREGALKMLVSKGKKEVAQGLLSFCETLGKSSDNPENIEKESSDRTWLKDDPSVPLGWMLKYVQFGTNTVTKLMSPNGHLIQGRRLALKYMIQQNYPEDQIADMKACLKVEGWSDNERLPKNWLYKSSRDGTSFIDSTGAHFKNKEHALKHLLGDGKKEFMETFNILKAFNANTSPSKKMSLLNDNWKVFDSEPLKGWKCKSDSAGHHRYLTPSGDYISGREHVMKFLVKNKYSQDAISAMKTILKSEKRIGA